MMNYTFGRWIIHQKRMEILTKQREIQRLKQDISCLEALELEKERLPDSEELKKADVYYKYADLYVLIKIKFGTYKAFGKAAGLSRSTVSAKMNNRSEFSRKDIELWAKILGIERKDYGRYFFA